MPEDQGVNGDAWNDEAAILLKRLSWEQIGDSNVDLTDEEGKNRGIDRLYQFDDIRRGNALTGVFVEAKRYETKNLQQTALETFIKTIDNKLNKIRNSKDFHETYPLFGDASLRTALIVIWFHDTQAYPAFRPKFSDYLSKVKLSAHSRNDGSNKIYVLHNDDFLRLASMVALIEEYEKEHGKPVNFYYPVSDKFNKPADRSKVLSIDYMFSKFVLAESVMEDGTEHKIVFYFGTLSVNSFRRLKSALQTVGYLDKIKPLTIYTYQRDSNFRKVKPIVEKEFNEVKFNIEEMDSYSDLPKFMKKK
jgi:hypothetical protein